MTCTMKGSGQGNNCYPRRKIDWVLWGSGIGVTILYLLGWQFQSDLAGLPWLKTMAHAVHSLMNTLWWGITIGFVMVGILSKIPREFVLSILGKSNRAGGIFRAILAGLFLDMCDHGILMVGAKLYERGVSVGQVIAFLLASPWNSFSFTLVLIAMVGLPLTLSFVILSAIIAFITGMIFNRLVAKGKLPANPHKTQLPDDFRFWERTKQGLKSTRFNSAFFRGILLNGLKESRMVFRWILFGVLLTALLRALVDVEAFQHYFGPTLIGLGSTILVATVIEVCSEGSTPIAADIVNRAGAPGNGFAFLMGGVATDYTEIMVMKEATKSWKIALLIPLITLPQILLVAWLMNL